MTEEAALFFLFAITVTTDICLCNKGPKEKVNNVKAFVKLLLVKIKNIIKIIKTMMLGYFL